MPDGEAYYADMLRSQTSTELTAQAIHQTGLAEVARIRKEIERVKTKSGFKDSLEMFFTHVRTDPQFRIHA